MSDTPLAEKTILITGASRGIGAAVARRYAALGAHVIAVARTVGGLEELDDAIKADGVGAATLVPMDLLQLEKIDELAVHIAERFGHLDVLVGNAAMLGGLRPLAHVTNDGWDEVMALNLTVNWRLLRVCDPLLRQAEAGQVLLVTSGVTRGSFPYWGPYAVSKAGLEMLAKTYAAEMQSSAVRVNLIDPGVVATHMRAEAMPGEDPAALPSPEDVAELFVDALLSPRETGEMLAA